MEKKVLAVFCCSFVINFTAGFSIESFFQTITVKNCGTSILPPSSPDRIVGGNKAKHGQYPWMIEKMPVSKCFVPGCSTGYNSERKRFAALGKKVLSLFTCTNVSLQENDGSGFEHVCGAAVLNENWIITAAHCIDFVNQPRKYQALVGLHKLSREDAPTVQVIKISKIVIHKRYDDETFENDIALLKAARPIDIYGSKGYVNGICLPRSNKDPTGYAKVTGWGHTKEDGENSDTLREVVVPIIPRDLCNEAYDDDPYDGFDEVTESMVCAGMTKRDSCQNDSGGPLIQTNSYGVSTLIGIVSHGAGCGEKFYPGVYTRVSAFRDWIERTVSKY